MKEEVVLRWLKKAENDLKTVKHLLTLEDAPTDVISFHCQQAVEKYFKAYLTLVDVRVKKIHDLETILALCTEKDKKFESLDKNRISKLTFYAVEIRYPEEYIELSIDEARELYETAKEVKEFIVEKLKEKGLRWK
ncbi:MAG: HEPN domain-containing protein [Methanophagales archaeon]|nr:HEPN domain-containing protein [Methanophagales archaeon]